MTDRTGMPAGWTRTTIGELFAPLHDERTLHQGWSPQCEDEPAADGEWGVLRTTAIQQGSFLPEHNKRLPPGLDPRPAIAVEPGDILLTCAGPRSRCGVPCLVRVTRPRLMMSGKMYRFRVPSDLMSAAFVEAFLMSSDAQAAIDRMKTGGSDSGLNLTQKRFRQLPIVVAPTAEQRRIVEAIDSYLTRLDDAVASLEGVQDKLKAFRTSVLKAAVEGRLAPTEASLARVESRDYEPADVLLARILTARRRRWEEAELARLNAVGKTPKDDKWKAKYQEPAAPDTSTLPELPEGWCWATTDQIFWFVTSGSRGWAKYYSASGATFIRIGNLNHDSVSLDLSDIQYVSPPRGSEGTRTRIAPGDVLVSITADVGMIGLVRDQLEEGYINQHISLARPVNEICIPYLGWFLAARDGGQKQFLGLQRGATKVGLGLDDIRNVNVPMPPLGEQRRIVDEVERRFSVAADCEAVVSRDDQRSRRLRQAILKWAFEGKLVDQDPADEPAETLLACIRAKRAGSAPIKKNRRHPVKGGA